MKIGVISDTHDFLDPKVPNILQGVEHILHAGDVGMPALILQLEEIAPVTVVMGNCDSIGNWRETEVVELGSQKFLLHHIVDVNRLSDPVQRRITKEKPDVVVFGHTHRPFSGRIGATLFFNPGSAGKARFGLPRTLAIFHLENGAIREEMFTL